MNYCNGIDIILYSQSIRNLQFLEHPLGMYIPKASKKANGNDLIGDWQLTSSNPTSANAWKNIWQQDFVLTCDICNDNEDICNDKVYVCSSGPNKIKVIWYGDNYVYNYISKSFEVFKFIWTIDKESSPKLLTWSFSGDEKFSATFKRLD